MSDDLQLPPAPPANMATGSRKTSVLAIISLVSGLLTWFSLPLVFLVIPTPICMIAAIVCGHLARSEIRRDPANIEGDGLAVAGLVLGWAMLVMIVLAVLAAVLLLGGIAVLLGWLGLNS